MLVIIADDLTGALDSAAPFAGRGLHTEVALLPEAIDDALKQGPAVLAVNLGSRELPATAATVLATTALASLPKGWRVFKKIDSRLKGNIAAELDAMDFRRCLVAPAIPEFARIVKGGHIQGFGVDQPIRIADKLGSHVDRCRIPDTTSQAELARALDAAFVDGTDLLIGARGLAEALADKLRGAEEARLATTPVGKAIFVIGSRDPITLAQIEHLRAEIAPDYIPAPNGVAVHSTAGSGDITLVQAVPDHHAASPADVSANLAKSVLPLLADARSTLLLSGGATAEAVLKQLGISRLRLLGECVPGLGLAYAGERCIITKSGGFGTPETLTDIAAKIMRKMR